MLIDHEYAAMNLIGIDIVNYMIESKFNYKIKCFPFFEVVEEKLDYDRMFDVYLKYLDEYENQLKSSKLIEDTHEKELFNECRSKDYFMRLICVISLLWFLYSIVYMDFISFEAKISFDQFRHALKRLEFFEKTYEMIEISD